MTGERWHSSVKSARDCGTNCWPFSWWVIRGSNKFLHHRHSYLMATGCGVGIEWGWNENDKSSIGLAVMRTHIPVGTYTFSFSFSFYYYFFLAWPYWARENMEVEALFCWSRKGTRGGCVRNIQNGTSAFFIVSVWMGSAAAGRVRRAHGGGDELGCWSWSRRGKASSKQGRNRSEQKAAWHGLMYYGMPKLWRAEGWSGATRNSIKDFHSGWKHSSRLLYLLLTKAEKMPCVQPRYYLSIL
jgi:hypothetical protein